MACQWAVFPHNLAVAARKEFPKRGPDFVWLTLGGNDLLSIPYLACVERAYDYASALLCAQTEATRSRNCNARLLLSLYAEFPHVQVVQCGYDFQCAQGNCLPFSRW